MTAQVAVLIVALGAMALRGFNVAAAAIGGGIVVFGFLLDTVYVLCRDPRRVSQPRVRLDRTVRGQLFALAIGTALLIFAFHVTGYTPLQHTAAFVRAAVIGCVVGAATIYASSLVDWYWIVPRVSGATGPAPCERPGGERWAGLTNIWLFHRAVATTVVTGVLAGVPGYMAGTSHSGSAGTVWALFGAALAIGYNSVTSGVRQAFFYAFNTTVQVGDWIRVRTGLDEAVQNAYVVDVSVQGLKYKVIHNEPRESPKFVQKGNSISMDELRTFGASRRVENPRPVCPGGPDQCQAYNWDCPPQSVGQREVRPRRSRWHPDRARRPGGARLAAQVVGSRIRTREWPWNGCVCSDRRSPRTGAG